MTHHEYLVDVTFINILEIWTSVYNSQTQHSNQEIFLHFIVESIYVIKNKGYSVYLFVNVTVIYAVSTVFVFIDFSYSFGLKVKLTLVSANTPQSYSVRF